MTMLRSICVAVIIGTLCANMGCVTDQIMAAANDPNWGTKQNLEKLKTGNNRERAEAAESFGDASPEMLPEIIPALTKALKDPMPNVRSGAALSFARLGNLAKQAVPDLENALNDRNGYVVINAAIALKKMKQPDAKIIAALENVENGKDGMLKVAAAERLYSFRGYDRDKVIKTYLNALSDPEVDVRKRAIDNLAEIRGLPKYTLSKITAALKDTQAPIRQQAATIIFKQYRPPARKALPVLIETLNNESDSSALFCLLLAIKSYGKESKAALPTIIHLLKNNESENVRAEAAAAIGKIGALNDQAVPALIIALTNDPDWRTRRASALSLSEVGSAGKSGIKALKQARQSDAEDLVRIAAGNSLRELGVKD